MPSYIYSADSSRFASRMPRLERAHTFALGSNRRTSETDVSITSPFPPIREIKDMDELKEILEMQENINGHYRILAVPRATR